jgi:hypothetical protein
MSTDYVLPDYSDKRMPEWHFKRVLTLDKVSNFIKSGLDKYETIYFENDIFSNNFVYFNRQ